MEGLNRIRQVYVYLFRMCFSYIPLTPNKDIAYICSPKKMSFVYSVKDAFWSILWLCNIYKSLEDYRESNFS